MFYSPTIKILYCRSKISSWCSESTGSFYKGWTVPGSKIVKSSESRKRKHENKTGGNYSRAFHFRVFYNIWEPGTGFTKVSRPIQLGLPVEHLQRKFLLAAFAYTTNILRFPSIFCVAKLSSYRDRAWTTPIRSSIHALPTIAPLPRI